MSVFSKIETTNFFLNYAHVEISFFGSRVVCSNLDSTSISIRELSKKVIKLNKKIYKPTQNQKIMFNAVNTKIFDLYRESEGKMRNVNFITKIFEEVREFLHFGGFQTEDYLYRLPFYSQKKLLAI